MLNLKMKKEIRKYLNNSVLGFVCVLMDSTLIIRDLRQNVLDTLTFSTSSYNETIIYTHIEGNIKHYFNVEELIMDINKYILDTVSSHILYTINNEANIYYTKKYIGYAHKHENNGRYVHHRLGRDNLEFRTTYETLDGIPLEFVNNEPENRRLDYNYSFTRIENVKNWLANKLDYNDKSLIVTPFFSKTGNDE